MKIRRRDKIKNYLSFNKRKLIPGLIVLTILLLSVGYSAFSSNLNIGGFLTTVRIKKDIRITGLGVVAERASTSLTFNYGDSYQLDLGDGVSRTFYVLEDGDNTSLEKGITGTAGPNEVALIMDRNYGGTETWCDVSKSEEHYTSSSCNADGLTGQLNEIKTAWTDLNPSQISLPTANQIAAAAGISELSQYMNFTSEWLYTNIEPGAFGYWTSTPYDVNSVYMVTLFDIGSLTADSLPMGLGSGVRPVITIPKSYLGSDEGVQNNGGKSTYTEYNVSSITTGIDLPNEDSSVTYKVIITNIGNAEAGILDVTGLPENLTYELLNYSLKDKICDTENKCSLGIQKEILMKIKYKDGGYNSSNTYYDVVADFNFQPYYTVTYKDIEGTGYPTEVMGQDTLTVDFGSNALPYIAVKIDNKKITNFTYSNGILTVPNVNGNVEVLDGLETYTGTYLALNNQNIYNYKIFGNSVQNGTPTPESPVEIVSIGENTNNLFNINNFNNTRVTVNGDNVTVSVYEGNSSQSTGATLQELAPNLEVGKTYYIYYTSDVSDAKFSIGSYATGNYWESGSSRTITETDLTSTVRIGCTGGGTINLSNIQVVEEETDVYEPYGKYKIPLTLTTENTVYDSSVTDSSVGFPTDIWSYKNYTTVGATLTNSPYLDESGNLILKGNGVGNQTYLTSSGKKYFEVKPNTEYKLSVKAKIETGANFYLYAYLCNGKTQLSQKVARFTQAGEGVYTLEFTTTENTNSIFLEINNYGGVLDSVVTVYQNTLNLEHIEEEKKVYNIILDEPLRKIGDYADYIDFQSGKLVRNVVEYTTTGNESFFIGATNTDTIRFYSNGYNAIGYGTSGNNGPELILSNKLQTSKTANVESTKCTGTIKDKTSGLFNVEILKTRFNYADTDTNDEIVQKFKSWLSSNPITLNWVINEYARPVEETIDLPELTTFTGTTYVSAGGADIELKVASK